MMMKETREQGFQHAWAESEEFELRASDAVDKLCSRLMLERFADYCRGYLWFYLLKTAISLDQADFVLNVLYQQHWDCDWFPRSWLEELPPIAATRISSLEQGVPFDFD
jgi:hypothetical protein